MNLALTAGTSSADYVLWFRSLFRDGHALAFPCDSKGRVDMDSLSERARINYLFARTAVGREFATPAVQPRINHRITVAAQS